MKEDIVKNIYINMKPKEFFLQECTPWLDADFNSDLFKNYGYTYSGICDGFEFYKDKIDKAPEVDLWKMLALSAMYWEKSYSRWLDQKEEENRELRQLLYILAHKEDLVKDRETAKIICSEGLDVRGEIPTLEELRREIGID